jgi:hypothetical protein
MQAAQALWPSQTPTGTLLVWQAVPGEASAFVSVQVIVPPAHAVTFPRWHGFPGGVHVAFGWQALQMPP